MKSYRNTFLTTLLASTFFVATAQENTPTACSNGIDDDGDGLVDCFDPECAPLGTCDDFFFGNSVVCFDEVDVTSFAIRQQWQSAQSTTTSHTSPAVGDLDQNGIPEVVVINNYGSTVTVLNGFDGTTVASRSVGFNPENTPAIANVFNDETTEILVTHNEGNRLKLFEGDLSAEVWSHTASRNDMGIAGFADFNEDGVPEVYYKNEIINAQTGARIITGDGDWERDYVHGPIAADILDDSFCTDCSGLELISGNHIWAINIGTGTRTAVLDMNDLFAGPDIYRPLYWGNWLDGNRSTVSVADYNLDGNMDVILTGAYGTTGTSTTDEVSVFFWDVANGTVTRYHDNTNNFRRGPGRVNIGDVDGDGQLNANFVMDQKLYSLKEDFTTLWIKAIKEGSSGFTGCTLFDFDGDGTLETVYRSEESLLVISGTDGSTRNELTCVSRTQEEYPVVADIDGDGASEICVACYTSDATPFSPYSNTQFSSIRVYESDGEAWMPARDVWNQHGYFNVNINDDLTVPTELQDHTLVFSDGLCEYSDGTLIPFPSRPLNGFLNQAPILDENGCVEFVSPDIVLLGNSISATSAVCPDAEIEVTITISNEGDTDISGGLPISYYAGDPTTAGATYLDTEVEVLTNFEVGQSLEIVQTINGIGGNYDLYVVANDLGGTPPIAAAFDELPNATIPECQTGNNYQSVSIEFTPFSLSVEKLNDDRRCFLGPKISNPAEDSIAANGSARAFYFGPKPGNQETLYLENFDELTNGTQSDVGATAWSSDPGTFGPSFYGVSDYQGSKMFRARRTGTSNDVGVVTWTSERIDISDHTNINVTVDIFENGNMEPQSSQWRDWVIMTYQILDINENVISSGQFPANGVIYDDFDYEQAQLSNIRLDENDPDSLLIITATIHNTAGSENHYIDNINVVGQGPDIIQEFTEADGFDFLWYNAGDYSTPIGNTSVLAGLAAGTYEAIASFPGTSCLSDTVSVEIQNLNAGSVPPYEVHTWLHVIDSLDNCDVPNGSLGAFVYTQTELGTFPANFTNNRPLDTLLTADGYQFTWFITTEGLTPIGTGDVLGNLEAIEYTVEAYELFSGCTGDADLLVPSGLNFPAAPTVNVTHITTCGGNGTLSASVGGNTTDYTFEWYNGPTITPSPNFIGAVYEPNEAIQYTVRAIQISSSCPSPETTVTLLDNSNAPTPSVSLEANNTSCGTPNGEVSADGDGLGTTVGFTFTWFKGANTLPGNLLPGAADPNAFLVSGNAHQLGGLEEGTYRLVLQDDATLCTDTLDINVIDDPQAVAVTPGNIVLNDINSCNLTAQGSVDGSNVVPPSGTPYVFELYIGTTVSAPADFTNNTGVFSNLDEGDYVLVVYDNITGCEAGRIDAPIQRFTDQPQIVTILTHDTNCISGVGIIQVTTSMPGTEPANYTYQLFDGHAFTTQIGSDAIVNNGATPFEFQNREAGNYRVNVINNDTECSDFVDVVINDATIDPVILSGFTNDNTSCGTANGVVSVTVDADGDMVADNANLFNFTWYDGDDSSAPPIAGAVDVQGRSTLSASNGFAIDAGFYTVVAETIGSECTSTEYTLEVYDSPYVPNIVITQVNPQTDCGSGNGSLTAYVTNDPTGVCTSGCMITELVDPDFSFKWYLGNDTSTPLDGSDPNGSASVGFETSTVSGLVADEYLVEVTYGPLGCTSTQTLTLAQNQVIPVVTLNSTQDNTGCSVGSYDGEILVDVAPAGTYDFDWFYSDNSQVTDGGTVTGSATNNLQGVIDDTYKVVATSTANCTSDTLVVILATTPDAPAFQVQVAGTNDNTVCDISLNASGVHNGQITVETTDASNATDYSYDWFVGASTDPADDLATNILTASISATGDVASQLPGGTYTVVITDVTNTGNNCTTTIQHTIDDATSATYLAHIPTATPAHVTACDGGTGYPDGGVSVNTGLIDAAGGSGSYTFRYYIGNSTSGTLIADGTTISAQKGGPVNGVNVTGASTSTISGLDAGEYTVEAIDNSTGCITQPTVVTINNNPDAPAFQVQVAGTNDNTVCDISLNASGVHSGQITVETTDASNATDYSYDWFIGASTDPADDLATNILTASISATGDVASQLPGGTYTVVITDVTNTGNNCTTTIQHTIDDATSATYLAHIPTATPAHVTACDGGTGYPDGGVSVNTGLIDAAGGSGSYTFRYYIGNSTSGTLIADGTTISAQKGGPVNGVNVTGASTSTISGLDAGEYTVEAIDNSTGCITQPTVVTINNNPDAPAFQVQVAGTNDNTVCDISLNASGVHNGQITVETTDASNATDYSYDWFVGASTDPADDLATNILTASISATGDVASQLPGGTYTVVITDVTNTGNNCTTTIQHTIDDATSATYLAHIPTATPAHVTACDGGTGYPDGGVSVNTGLIDAAGGSGSYTFRYYIGNSTSGTLIADGTTISAQKGGPVNGVNVTGASTSTISGLDAGEYTVEAIDNSTGCITQPTVVTINNNPDAPAFQVQVAGTNDNTVCDISLNASGVHSGQITVETTDASNATDYSYDWFVGASTDPADDLVTNILTASISATGDVASQLPGGTYTVVITDVTNTGNNCTTTIQHTIDDATSATYLAHIPTATPAHVTACDGGTGYPDGGVSVNTGLIDAAGGSGSYTFRYYIGNSTSGTLIADGTTISAQKGGPVNGVNVTGASTSTISGLDAGEYTVEAIDNSTGCITQPTVVTINNNPDAPAFQVQVAGTNDNTVCDISLNASGVHNGQITVETTDASNATDYSYDWFVGASTDPADDLATNILTASISATGDVASQLPGGTYTVVITDVTNTGNNCTTTIQHTIDDATSATYLAHIPTATPAHVTACDGGTGYPDGGVSVNTGLIDAAGGSGSYTFRYYIGNSTSGTLIADGTTISAQKGGPVNGVNVTGASTSTISGLDAGEYTVEAIDNSTGCITQPTVVTINNNPDAPAFQVQVAGTNDNTVCDISLTASGEYNGQVTVETTDASNATDYSYDWFVGASTDPADDLVTNVPTASISATGDVASELPGGTYTVVITDVTNTGNNCTTTIQATIDDTPTVITVGGTPNNVNVCTGAANYPNGGVDVTPAGGSGNYSYEWYYGGGVNAANLLDNADDIFTQKSTAGSASVNVSGSTTASISGLDPGDYTVRVLDTERGCYSAGTTFTVGEDPSGLSLGAFTNVVDNYSCDLLNPSGGATANGAGAAGTETYEWYAGASATGTVVFTGQTSTGLAAGLYTVKYIDGATNCFVTAQVTIDEFEVILTPSTSNVTQTDCTPNGEAHVTGTVVSFNPAGPPSNYPGATLTYQWYFGPGTSSPMTNGVDPGNGSNPVGVTTADLTGLAAGTYTVVVTDTESTCTSATTSVTVLDGVSANAPTLEFNNFLIPNSCDAIGTFQVRMAVNPTGNSFAFEFYEGAQDYANLNNFGDGLATNDQLLSNPGQNITVNTVIESTAGGPGYNNEIVDVVSGVYTVVVTDQTTGCRYQEYHNFPFLNQQTTTTITVENVDECPDNGVARVGLQEDGGDGFNDGDVDDISEYILFLYAGNGVPADRISPYTFEGIRFPLKYDAAVGAILDGDDAVYANAGQPTPALIEGEEAEFHGLPAGPYIAVAREIPNPAFNPPSTAECWSQASFDQEIVDLAYEPLIDNFSMVANSICDVPTYGGNGQLSVTATEDPAEDMNNPEFQQPAGFRFSFVRDADLAVVHNEDIFTNPATSVTATNLEPGDYTVTIERAFQLTDVTYTLNTGAFVDGEVVDFSGGGVGVIITDNGAVMNVYITTGATPIAAETITGRGSAATGTVNVVAAGAVHTNGCQVSDTYTVQDDPEIHDIVNAAVVDYNNCNATPASTITINNNDIEIGGVGQLAANYTYQWFKGSLTNDITVTVGTGNSIDMSASGLTPIADTYFVVATSTVDGCVTPAFQVEIADNTQAPDISITGTTDDSSCDPDANEGNGNITFQINSPDLNTDYDFQWYDSGGTPLVDAGTITGSNGTLNGAAAGNYISTIDGIDAGTYTLEVIDQADPNNTCAVTTEVTINEVITDPNIELTATYVDLDNNTNCTGPNGSIEIIAVQEGGVDVTVTALNYTFQWFQDPLGVNTDITASAVAGLTEAGNGNRIQTLSGDTYGVIITNTATQCSSLATIEIPLADDQVNPTLSVETQTDDTYCDNTGEVGDGTLSIDLFHDGVQLDNPTVSAANYTVEWYRGTHITRPAAGVLDANFLFDNQANPPVATVGDALVGADISILTGLSDGTYTAYVIRTGAAPNTGCDNIATFTIGNDEPVLTVPEVAANIDADDNTNCTAPNGAVEILRILEDATPINVTAGNYTFQWFQDPLGANTDITASAVAGLTQAGVGNRIENLSGDTYAVIVTNATTGCVSAAIEVTIDDNQVSPTLSVETQTDDTYCDNTGEVGDGTLSIDLFHDGVQLDNPTVSAANYTVEWYRGTHTTRPAAGVLDANFLFDNQANPPVATVGDALVGADISILTGLSDGTYTAYVIRTGAAPNTGCDNIATFTIGNDEPVLTVPEVAANIDADDNTNCTAPNGAVEILRILEDATPINVTAGNYTFQWFQDPLGANTDITASAVAGLTEAGVGNRIENLSGDTYAVIVTNATTGCVSAAIEVTIDDNQVSPTLSVETQTDDTYCDNTGEVGDGTLSIDLFHDGVQLDNPTVSAANYTVEWYRGTHTTRPAAGVLDANFLFDNQANPPVATVGDALVGADISILTGLSDGTYTAYVIRTGAAPNTGCDNIATFTIGNDEPVLTVPEVAANIDADDNTNCTAPNGAVEILRILEDATPINVTAGNYTFQWFQDPLGANTDITASAVAGLTEAGVGNRIENLSGDTYAVIVTNATTGCVSAAIEVTIDDNQVSPTLSVETQTDDTYCDNTGEVGDGTLSIDLFHDGVQLDNPTVSAANYTVEWYRGTHTTRPAAGVLDANFLFDNQANPPVATVGDALVGADISILTGLSDGTYTAYVIRTGAAPNTGCDNIATFTIGNDEPVLTVPEVAANIDADDNTNCTAPNGAVEILRILEDATPINVTAGNYTFQWFQDPLGANTDITASAVAGLTEAGVGNRIENLSGDTYAVIVTNATTGCVSAAIEVTIDDNQVSPTLSVETQTDDTYCDNTGEVGDGTLSIDLFHDGVQLDNPTVSAANYTVEWYRGTHITRPAAGVLDANFLFDNQANPPVATVGDALVGADISILTGLSDGTYTAYVIRTGAAPNTGCDNIATFTIGNDEPVLTVPEVAANIDADDNTNCTAPNGAVEILRILEDATPINVTAGNYTFQWFQDPLGANTDITASAVAGLTQAGVGNRIENLSGDTYAVIVTNATTGCVSAAIEVTIDDNQVSPTLSVETQTDDTYCDNTGEVGDGTLSIDLFHDGVQLDNPTVSAANYTVEWYRGTHITRPAAGVLDANFLFDNQANPPVATVGDALVGADISILTGLSDGTYTAYVIRTGAAPNTGCDNIATFTVGNTEAIPVLDIAAIEATIAPDTICSPPGANSSGTFVITDLNITPGNLSNYDVTIRQGSPGGAIVFAAAPAASPINLTTLIGGTDYYIFAENTTTGCFAATGIINVPDSIRNPQIGLVSMTPDRDCVGGTADTGGLEIIIDSQFDETDHFTVQWYTGSGAIPANILGGETSVIITDLNAGDYSVEVTNTNTSCSQVADFTVTTESITPSIFSSTTTDNTTCDDDGDNLPVDNGTFSLLEVVFDGAVLDTTMLGADYSLAVFDNLAAPVPLVGGGTWTYRQLSAGDYTAEVTRVDANCTSNALAFTIQDVLTRPVITINLVKADSTCDVTGTADGTLSATVNGGLTNTIDYSWQWHTGSTATAPIGGEINPTISGLDAGTYTLEVTLDSTGCTSTESFVVPNVEQIVNILAAAVVDAPSCNGIGSSVTVMNMNFGVPADYDFAYYDQDPTVGSPAPIFTGNAGAPLLDQAAGTYYIIGTHIALQCPTEVFQAEIGENYVYPDVALERFSKQTNCDPDNPNGYLAIMVDGNLDPGAPNYTVNWFFGTDTSNPLDETDIGNPGTLFGANTDSVAGIPAGFYTVEVTDNTSGCSSTLTLEMTDEINNPFLVAPSTSANTNCSFPNGIMSAQVVKRGDRAVTDFNYYWYIGDQTATDPLGSTPLAPFPAPDFTGSLVTNAAEGTYTLFVVDTVDPFCRSTAQLVEIEDGTSPPDYTLEVRHVSICFDQKDGYVEVTVPDIGQVDIEWIDDANNVISTNSLVDSLDAGSYILQITDKNLGCVATEVFNINNDAIIPSDPEVIVNNVRTNCSEPNGDAVATVDGDQSAYTFEWFTTDDLVTPYATGGRVTNLDSGTYLVRATNLTTGCESALTSVEIDYEITDPVFEIQFSVAACLRTEDGSTNQFDGTAIVVFDEPNEERNYRWEDEFGNLVGEDSRLIDAGPGTYTVTFTADNGCEYTRSFSMETLITVYNGVSANGDRLNDFFLIDCIDYFTNNTVQIFARDGVKVFEQDGYDNITNRFEGFSNVGGSALQLPSGTYFYIIDLGDGRDPQQGYLELVR